MYIVDTIRKFLGLIADERQLEALLRALCQDAIISELSSDAHCGTVETNQIVSKLKALTSILVTELGQDDKTTYRIKQLPAMVIYQECSGLQS